MSDFRLRNDFSNGQDARISLLLVDELGGTAGEGALSTLTSGTLVPNSPYLDRLPPSLDLVKDLPFKILEDLHRVLNEHGAGQASGSRSMYWAPAPQCESVAGHCGKLRCRLLCHENASTGFMVDFRLLVGRCCMYADGNEMYGMMQGIHHS